MERLWLRKASLLISHLNLLSLIFSYVITMKIGVVYFSGTGNTAKIGQIISSKLNELGIQANIINITPFNDRKKILDFNEYDALVFGFPVYGSVIPSVCRDWLDTIKGENKHCAMFFTYGGPTMGIAHYHTKLLLNKQGFKVLASAEFLGKHSYNIAKGFNFLENRPNQDDFNVAKEYAIKLFEIFTKEKREEIIFEKHEKADSIMERIRNKGKTVRKWVPSRNGKDCSMCRTCEESCPTNAFNADTGEADKEKCINCMRCVTACPDEVIEFNIDMTEIYEGLISHYELTDEILRNLESKILF